MTLLLVIAFLAWRFAGALARTGAHTGLGVPEFRALTAAGGWGAVVGSDLIASLLTISGWVFLREGRGWDRAVWITLILYWGDIVVCGYVLWLLYRHRGRWDGVLLGARSSASAPLEALRPPSAVRGVLLATAAALGLYVAWACWRLSPTTAAVVGHAWALGGVALALARAAVRTR